jgi:hypothetical protein
LFEGERFASEALKQRRGHFAGAHFTSVISRFEAEPLTPN